MASIGSGLQLTSAVLADSVCPTLQPTFSWSFASGSPTFTIPAGAASSSNLNILGMDRDLGMDRTASHNTYRRVSWACFFACPGCGTYPALVLFKISLACVGRNLVGNALPNTAYTLVLKGSYIGYTSVTQQQVSVLLTGSPITVSASGPTGWVPNNAMLKYKVNR